MIKEKTLILKNLETDFSYQSPVNEAQVSTIVRNFDGKALHTIVVSEREDGTYWIVDGQHRVVALIRLGRSSIKCTVHTDLTVTDEAEMYRKINERKMKSKNAFAKADLKSGVPYAVEIDYLVRKSGFLVDYEKRGRSSNSLKAYESLRRVYDKLGAEHLHDTLIIGKDIFGGTYSEMQGWVIEGLAEFLNAFPEFDEKRMKEKMSGISFAEIKKMNNQKKVEIGKSPKKSLPFTLVNIYNKRLSKDKQLDAMKLLV